jgi:hypothetical protein
MTALCPAYQVIWDLVKQVREERAMKEFRDGQLTRSTNAHDKRYLETVADGNSDYWRAKVAVIRKDLVIKIGEQAFFDFIDSLPDGITYAGIFEAIERELKGEITPSFVGQQFKSMIE